MAKVFVTGATGFIGPSVVKSLIKRGHTVVGLCRSEKSAAALKELGGEPVQGDLASLDVLKEQANACDGVIHLAFIHDFADFAGSCKADKDAILAMLEPLEGTGKPFIGTSGTLVYSRPIGSALADETSADSEKSSTFGLRNENAHILLRSKDKGVNSQIVRLSPTVHGEGDRGFVPKWIEASKKLGYVPYFDEGENQWTAVNKQDAGEIYALAFDKGTPGSVWHAAAENVKIVDIAKVIAKKIGLEAKSVPGGNAPLKELGFISIPLQINAPVKTDITRTTLGWKPEFPTIFEDIENYY